MKAHFTAGLAAIVLSGLLTLPAKAEIVTWQFGGQITSSTAPTFLPPVGTNFTGSVTFTTTPGGTVSPDGTHADWANTTITSFKLDGPASLWNNMVLPNNSGTITVDNNAALDQLLFQTLQGEFVVTLNFQQHASNPSALTSVSPPRESPTLSLFDVATFSIVDRDLLGGPPGPGGRSSGVITSLTGPPPLTAFPCTWVTVLLWLLLLLLLGLTGAAYLIYRRRKLAGRISAA